MSESEAAGRARANRRRRRWRVFAGLGIAALLLAGAAVLWLPTSLRLAARFAGHELLVGAARMDWRGGQLRLEGVRFGADDAALRARAASVDLQLGDVFAGRDAVEAVRIGDLELELTGPVGRAGSRPAGRSVSGFDARRLPRRVEFERLRWRWRPRAAERVALAGSVGRVSARAVPGGRVLELERLAFESPQQPIGTVDSVRLRWPEADGPQRPDEVVFDAVEIAGLRLDLRSGPIDLGAASGRRAGLRIPNVRIGRVSADDLSLQLALRDRRQRWELALERLWCEGRAVRLQARPLPALDAGFLALGAALPGLARDAGGWVRTTDEGETEAGVQVVRLLLERFAPQLAASERIERIEGEATARIELRGGAPGYAGRLELQGRRVVLEAGQARTGWLEHVLALVGGGGELDVQLPFRLEPELRRADAPEVGTRWRMRPLWSEGVRGLLGDRLAEAGRGLGRTLAAWVTPTRTEPERSLPAAPAFEPGSARLDERRGLGRLLAWARWLEEHPETIVRVTGCAVPQRDGASDPTRLRSLAFERSRVVCDGLRRCGVPPARIAVGRPRCDGQAAAGGVALEAIEGLGTPTSR